MQPAKLPCLSVWLVFVLVAASCGSEAVIEIPLGSTERTATVSDISNPVPTAVRANPFATDEEPTITNTVQTTTPAPVITVVPMVQPTYEPVTEEAPVSGTSSAESGEATDSGPTSDTVFEPVELLAAGEFWTADGLGLGADSTTAIGNHNTTSGFFGGVRHYRSLSAGSAAPLHELNQDVTAGFVSAGSDSMFV